MKVTHLHGMCKSSFERFIQGKDKQSGPWMVSDKDNYSYLYSVEKHIGVIPVNGKRQEAIDMLQVEAVCSAILQCALKGEGELYVLFCNLDSSIVTDDYSCENMQGIADSIPESDLKDSVVYIRKFSWHKWYSPLVIASMRHRDYFNTNEVDPVILKTAECIKSEFIMDDIFEAEFIEEFKI